MIKLEIIQPGLGGPESVPSGTCAFCGYDLDTPQAPTGMFLSGTMPSPDLYFLLASNDDGMKMCRNCFKDFRLIQNELQSHPEASRICVTRDVVGQKRLEISF